MPNVDIPQELFSRLEGHARGFDTPIAVITRAVDALDRETTTPPPVMSATRSAPSSSLPDFEALYPPNLTHTKVVSASFDGKAISPANWNRMLDAALIHAAKQVGDFAKLQKIAGVNMVKGEKTDEGYHFLPDAGLSVQGQDANAAWRGIVFIAQNLKCACEVSFLWRNKEGAENPGKSGTMRMHGK
jgi:hypothetical protein